MSRISSIVTASEPNRTIEMARRIRRNARERGDFLSGRAGAVAATAHAGLTVMSDRVSPCSERIVDVDIADPYLRYQPTKTV